MNVDVIIFDLDDTLYNEIEFVKSGFSAVSEYLADKFNINQKKIFNSFMKELEKNGRGKIFDVVLEKYQIKTYNNIKKALAIYRTHKPKITLPQQSIQILKHFNSFPIYIITDGNKIVQSNKIKSLEIEKFVKKVFITHRFGKIHSKPSTYCFEKIAKLEKQSFQNIVYIGDNPHKDFINIKKLGFKTIRILNGMFKEIKMEKEYEADINIQNLNELKNILKKNKAYQY